MLVNARRAQVNQLSPDSSRSTSGSDTADTERKASAGISTDTTVEEEDRSRVERGQKYHLHIHLRDAAQTSVELS